MDIPKLSMSMAATKVSQGVNISMMKKSMEQMEQTGAQFAEMMKATAAIPQGSTIDIRI